MCQRCPPFAKSASELQSRVSLNVAITIAMRLLALCCPGVVPKATKADVGELIKQYTNWWKNSRNVPIKKEKDCDDSADEMERP